MSDPAADLPVAPSGAEVDLDEVRDTWDLVAPGWDRYETELTRLTVAIRRRLLELLDPRPGETILDVAAGTGTLSLAIASAVGPRGKVLCTDLSPRMVAAAHRHVRLAGATNISCEIMDAHDPNLPDHSVEGAVCSFGYMLMPDPSAALRATRRVLRPGGRLVLATWGAPERNLWIVLVGAALLHHGYLTGMDPTGPGGVFSLSDQKVVVAAARSAGFAQVTTETVDLEHRFSSFDAYWDLQVATGGPIAAALAQLDEAEVARVRTTCETFCASAATGDGHVFSAQAIVARAV